jgi:hypothetical protein
MNPRVATVVALSLFTCVALCGCKKRARQRPLPAETGLSGGKLLFEEQFEAGLSHWNVRSKNWRVVDGRLYTGDRPNDNKGLWLSEVSLPKNVRIEFDATAVKGKRATFEGDIKCEFGGEKAEHASGYIIIFGGWKNTVNTIAKQDEHGEGRLVVDGKTKVKEDQTYRFSVVRLEGEVKWFLGDKLLLRVKDSSPLYGGVFGFNNWNSRVYFDNVRVYAL